MYTQGLKRLSTEEIQQQMSDSSAALEFHTAMLKYHSRHEGQEHKYLAAQASAYITLHGVFIEAYLAELTARMPPMPVARRLAVVGAP